jgi:hypothetical protein
LRKSAAAAPQDTIVAQELLGVHNFVQASGHAVLFEANKLIRAVLRLCSRGNCEANHEADFCEKCHGFLKT